MNLEEFELHYRNKIEQSLNQLQTAVLLVTQVQARLTSVGQDLQSLSQALEEFVIEQRNTQ